MNHICNISGPEFADPQVSESFTSFTEYLRGTKNQDEVLALNTLAIKHPYKPF